MQFRIVLVAIGLVLGYRPASAATFQVTNTNSSGAGSLAAAIEAANANPDEDAIDFEIAGTGIKTIVGPFPAITQPLTISGLTQAGTSSNTSTSLDETNAVLRIRLAGTGLATGATVLQVNTGPTLINGLIIGDIPAKGFGVMVAEGASQVVVSGCFIGTDAAGTGDDSDGTGILLDGPATIGGVSLASRNLISGNDGAGISVRGSFASIRRNLIGTTRNGDPTLGNNIGVQIGAGASDNLVGTNGQPNVIAGNLREGILVQAAAGGGNQFLGNAIHDNGDLGIDIGDDGPTPNDEADADTGPNGRQNFPEIASARYLGAALTVDGTLTSAPGTYRLDFAVSESEDDSGFGEGAAPAFTLDVEIPEGESSVRFETTGSLGVTPAEPVFVTATATNLDTEDTSEYSRALEAPRIDTATTVINTLDSGVGSLRAALLFANTNADATAITFAIPGDGPHVISLQSPLAILTGPAYVDGYTQQGSELNTLAEGTNAVPGIVLDGDAAGSHLAISGVQAVVRGIAFVGDVARNIRTTGVDGARIDGCFVGVDADGVTPSGSELAGIDTNDSNDVQIGGPARGQRNIVSAGGLHGILDSGTNTKIFNNIIGAGADGSPLPNAFDGIHSQGSGATIGGDEADELNEIRFNGQAGIRVQAEASGIDIRGNRISGNGTVGIDLREAENEVDGVSANDVDDADDGGNAMQNFPVVTEASAAAGTLTMKGTLDVPPGEADRVYRLRLFANDECDESGNGEGQRFVDALNVFIPAAETFSLQIPADIANGEFLTMTATDPETGNTSEFSECFEVGATPPLCGDASGDENIAAGDALFTLQAAVGTRQCALCICDANGSGSVTSPDALLVLRVAVGQNVTLDCPDCN